VRCSGCCLPTNNLKSRESIHKDQLSTKAVYGQLLRKLIDWNGSMSAL
jgi:hypothetical protein